MTESFRSTPPGQQWSGSNPAGNGYQSAYNADAPAPPPGDQSGEAGKALIVGILGGLVSAAGYLVYRRLPEDQKERIHAQARTFVQQRISEIRQNFNI